MFLLVFGVIIWGFSYFSWHPLCSVCPSLCCQTTLLNNFARSTSSGSTSSTAGFVLLSCCRSLFPSAPTAAWQSRKVNFLIRVASKTKQLVSLSEQSFFVLPPFLLLLLLLFFLPFRCCLRQLLRTVGSAVFLISLPCFGQNYARACELLKK